MTSFLTIGVVWMAHSAITSALRAANATIYRLNLLVLLFVSFLPFPTKLVAGFVFYGLALLALIVALTFFSRFAFEQRGLHKEHIDEETAAAAVDHRPSYLFYAVAIVLGALFPGVGRALYLGTALPRGPCRHDPPPRARLARSYGSVVSSRWAASMKSSRARV